MNNRLLLFANDAASANVTVAYAYFNKNNFDEIIAYPIGVAKEIYQKYIKEYIVQEKPLFYSKDTVVTGTSGLNSDYEMGIIKQAKEKNVKYTITIIDNITNFDMRFILDNKIISSEFLADEIWVFQKNFKTNILEIQKRIVYKEDVYIKFLQDIYTQNIPLANHKIIQKYKNNYIVILTEYLYELYGLEFGFTEYDMLENILQSIEKLHLNIPILLKLHPRENSNKFNIILRKYSSLNIFKDNYNTHELIYYSKLIFGINSSVFKESTILNKPTYSIQINSKKNMLMTSLQNENIIYNKNQLTSIIKKYFT